MGVGWVGVWCAALSLVPPVSAGSPWAGTSVVGHAATTVSKMSLDEKLSMIWGRNVLPPTGPIPKRFYYVGNVPATPRLGLPSLNLEDGPQGVADGLLNVTQWPSQMTVSMTWSTELMHAWGAAMGAEQRGKGTNVMLGPDVNLARVPWSGRVFETMGEDPYLASALVGPLVRGIQSNNISGCVKHFIYNNHEVNRQSFSANVDERVGRELYAPGFLAAVDAGVGSVMCAFNRVNNTFSCENDGALQKLLKDVGGFRGWVVTDWGAQHDSVLAANSGLDQEMEWNQGSNTTRYGQIGFANKQFKEAVINGTVPMARLDNMVTRMVEPMLALGLAATPPQTDTQNTEADVQSSAHFALAASIADQSICLLKNEGGLLPLTPLKPRTSATTEAPPGSAPAPMTVAVFGNPWFRAGSGSGGVQYTPVAGLHNDPKTGFMLPCDPPACNPDTAFLAQLLASAGVDVTMGNDKAQAGIMPIVPSDFNATKAAAEAAAADYAVVIVYQMTGEGRDRTSLALDEWQNTMVTTVAKANPRVVVVARCSGAFEMPWLDAVPAVLYQLVPGQAAGHAAAGALLGSVNPGGKLTVSFPQDMNHTWLGVGAVNPRQYPGTVRANTWQEADYTEGLEVGYRWYDAHPEHTPLFPFGFGLSFTTFSFGELVASASGAAFTVTNTGAVPGTEVAQLYVGFPAAAGLPPKQLKGFERLQLAPGASHRVTLPLSPAELSAYSVTAGAFVSVKGKFRVMVGASADDIRLTSTFTVV